MLGFFTHIFDSEFIYLTIPFTLVYFSATLPRNGVPA